MGLKGASIQIQDSGAEFKNRSWQLTLCRVAQFVLGYGHVVKAMSVFSTRTLGQLLSLIRALRACQPAVDEARPAVLPPRQ